MSTEYCELGETINLAILSNLLIINQKKFKNFLFVRIKARDVEAVMSASEGSGHTDLSGLSAFVGVDSEKSYSPCIPYGFRIVHNIMCLASFKESWLEIIIIFI